LRHNAARPDILAADETQSVDALLCLVTTGLDPVVHADSQHMQRCPMDCRIKFGNDGRGGVTLMLTRVSISVTKEYLARLRDVFSRHT
jgi:hypothetical protein